MAGHHRGRWWLASGLIVLGLVAVVLNYKGLLPGGTSQSWLGIALTLALLGALLIVAFVIGSLSRSRADDGDDA